MRRVTYRRTATREIREAAAWYERQRSGLGTDFYNEIVASVRAIQSNPFGFAPVCGDIREGVPERFPYRVYYRIRSNWIVVVGVIHTARDPAVWQTRR